MCAIYVVEVMKIVLVSIATLVLISCSAPVAETQPAAPSTPVVGREVENRDESFDKHRACENLTPPHGEHAKGWLRVLTGKRKTAVLQAAEIKGTPYVLEIQKRRSEDPDEEVCDYVIYNKKTKQEELRIYSGIHSNPAPFYEFSTAATGQVSVNRTAVYLAPDGHGMVVDGYWNADHEEYAPFYLSWEGGQLHQEDAIRQPLPDNVVEEDWELRGWSDNRPVYGMGRH